MTQINYVSSSCKVLLSGNFFQLGRLGVAVTLFGTKGVILPAKFFSSFVFFTLESKYHNVIAYLEERYKMS